MRNVIENGTFKENENSLQYCYCVTIQKPGTIFTYEYGNKY